MFENARDRSVVCQFADSGQEYVRSAFDRSSVGRTIERLSDDSRTASPLSPALENSVANATIIAPFVAAGERVRRGVDDAQVTTLGMRLRRFVESSFLYRWLTAEPEPDVIVIDLRETKTAGPAIEALDRTVRELAPGVPTSRITAVAMEIADYVRDRPVRVGSLVVLASVLASLVVTALTRSASVPLVAVYLLLAVLSALGLRSTTTLSDLEETRTAQFLIAAFEPPEPPAAMESREKDSTADRPRDDGRSE